MSKLYMSKGRNGSHYNSLYVEGAACHCGMTGKSDSGMQVAERDWDCGVCGSVVFLFHNTPKEML